MTYNVVTAPLQALHDEFQESRKENETVIFSNVADLETAQALVRKIREKEPDCAAWIETDKGEIISW